MVGNASTVIALAGTIVTSVVTVATMYLKSRGRERLRAIDGSVDKGSAIVADAIASYNLPTEGLSPAQTARLVREEIVVRDRRHQRRFRFLVVLVLVLSVTTVLLAFRGSYLNAKLTGTDPALVHDFTLFDSKIRGFVLAARNVRNVFGSAGAAALDPDPQTDRDITLAFQKYNNVHDDLLLNQESYADPVIHGLDGQAANQRNVRDAMSRALEDVHRRGVLQFNNIYSRATKIRKLRQDPSPDAQTRIRDEISEGISELNVYTARIDADLDSLEELMRPLRLDILGHD